MNFTLIGSGNMAAFLLQHLISKGHKCHGIWGRNIAAVEILCDKWQLRAFQNLEEIEDDAAFCMLAVADDAISEISSRLSFQNTVLLHASGALDMEVLAEGAKHYGVLWPVFSIIKNDAASFGKIPLVYESSGAEANSILKSIAEDIGDSLYEANLEQRRALHLAAVFANNFTNHIAGIAQEICKENDLPLGLLSTLLEQTFTRLKSGNAKDFQTGPAKRGDEETMAAHRVMLAGHPTWKAIYDAVSEGIKGEGLS